MTESLDRRIAELRTLQQTDPRSLIELYCRVVGQVPTNQLPNGVSFHGMIAFIAAHEAKEMETPQATK